MIHEKSDREKYREDWYVWRYRHSYMLMGAMRGPDSSSDEGRILKRVITARLRALVFTEEECKGLYLRAPLTRGEFDALTQHIDRLTTRDLLHYVTHLRDAVAETCDHPIWGKCGQDLVYYLMHLVSRPQEVNSMPSMSFSTYMPDTIKVTLEDEIIKVTLKDEIKDKP